MAKYPREGGKSRKASQDVNPKNNKYTKGGELDLFNTSKFPAKHDAYSAVKVRAALVQPPQYKYTSTM